MALVIDASMAGTWLLPDEESAACTAIGQRVVNEGASVPDSFWHEIRNLLIMAVQRRRIGEAQFWEQLRRIVDMPIQSSPQRPSAPIARLALQHKLTSYDAAYLDLAIAMTLPLATLDRKLRSAATAENVALLPPEMG